ncbi:sulfotransferase 4A1 isoform X2 [Diaphorina citri]|uniref:Sulfotransferase 4A1 isoform X2 n=1 Tax=Diaphorina citri TaxID=121845 RepID=A0A3Q0JEW1_DIACI|nr:sulfotransferase 4A1 isoform X2 [Diaphorina citri]
MNNNITKFPYKVSPLDPKQNAQLRQHFKGESSHFVQVGPERYLFPSKYESDAEKIYNFPVRPDDVWVVTFPRSGTTWTQELVWLIANGLNYEEARTTPLTERFPFLEFNVFVDNVRLTEFRAENSGNLEHQEIIDFIATPQYEKLRGRTGRRFIKTHIPLSLLPPDLMTSGAKVIYVARNPKDVAVSYFNLYKLFRTLDFTGDFDTFWNYFQNDLVGWAPYWNHVKEGWSHRDNPNVLFLFYEDMNKDLPSCIHRVSEFLSTPLTQDQIEQLAAYLDIKNFRANPSVNFDQLIRVGVCRAQSDGFIRQGKSGGWKSKFSSELNMQADKWIEENLRNTDIRFPE